MNTKAFVNGFDPENTVKGYYDENDQLVLVEPEGSGGGDSDFTTAKITVQGFGSEPSGGYAFLNGLVLIDTEHSELASTILLPDGTYDILLYKGSQICTVSDTFGGLNRHITVSGDYEDGIITGDITVTLEPQGGE